MSDLSYRVPTSIVRAHPLDWGAIWGGTFVFMAIWSVFATLGVAIFASVSNPAVARPILGMSVGISIWFIVLTVIAMYFAGRETGRFAGVTTRHDGLIHGLMMFGLSVVGLTILFTLGGAALSGGTGVNATVHQPYIVTVWANIGWGGFVALFLGWLAAMMGASSGVVNKTTAREVREVRPAA